MITVLRIDEQGTKWELDDTSRVVWLGQETLGNQKNIQAAAATYDTRGVRSRVAHSRQLVNEDPLRHDEEASSELDREFIKPYGEIFQKPATKSYTLVPRLRLRKTGNVGLAGDSDKKLNLIAQALRKFNVQTPWQCDEEATSQLNSGYSQQHDAETSHPLSTTSHFPIPKFRLRRKDGGLQDDDVEKVDEVDADNGISAASKPRSKSR